jgi:carbamate kinase
MGQMGDSANHSMRIVVALGGNALARRGEAQDTSVQRRNLRVATRVLARLALDHAMVVTHGNGPQVGLLALQSEAISGVEPLPLDVLGAQTQGMIGYMIEDELRDELAGAREVATLLTQVVVDARDPAFDAPSKPIGPVYGESDAKRLAAERGWTVRPDGGHWRRAVPSPEPIRILEMHSVRILLDAGVVVICSGGGGVPVVADEAGGWRGVEAVVDKDLSAALLADRLDADRLLMLTDVDAVYEDWEGGRSKPIRRATSAELRRLNFAPGSMGPKVEAACRFVEAGDRVAHIGALGDAHAMLCGDAGTQVIF